MFITTAFLCATFIAAPIPKERANAEKVVGTWKLVKSTNMPDGVQIELILELTRDGKMIIRQSAAGNPASVYQGEYKLIKNELPYSMNLPGGAVKKETLTVKKLTETELHVVDPDGIQEDFVRVKEDRKPDPKKD